MPHWLTAGSRSALGLRFQCPCQHEQHEIAVWFRDPPDGSAPEAPSGVVLHHHDGLTFDDLSLHLPIECGDCLIVIYKGVVNVLYVD